MVKTPCPSCSGQGQVRKTRKVVVSFPAGIDTGQRLRIPGQGMPGDPGAPPGDLYVDVELEHNEHFERDGSDLVTKITVGFADVALGSSATVRLLDDTDLKIDIPSGTQPGETVVAKGKGVPRVDGRGRGNLIVLVEVMVPKKMSSRAKELIRELQEELSPKK